MSQAIKNVLNSFVFPKVEEMKVDGEFKSVIVTPEILDEWETALHGTMKENDQKIGKARIRELIVCYIIDEFNLDAFGIPTNKKPEISERTIRKMKNQRKKGFVDLKIVKAAK
ncbi:hypothetical protein CPTAKMNP4_063 [Salmonella phage vB_SenM-AKM_NP4]|uniref:Phage protein n=2 Tax=Gelderlandvirus TaxID=1913653 RepID=M1EA95_BPS16|nr:hypothetical protein I133_gp208 [Salmonella phage vB_SenM-S16]YP_009126268.1 hypothetical protein STP4a_060 [Salmonella phage STP4-a]UFK27187.1 hypothetical protein LG358_00166 [Escherichia phage UoN_LG358_1]WDR21729.1 hypothetical protein PJM34_0061 [Salmonella phage vB_SenM_UTK0003]WKV23411.1 hypothetical protein SEA1_gp0063 [Salmonella phage SEA1]WLI71688.1 hypothetical protein CPTAKMNP4_063 [Salmonella phage vB_SenM-AKM_NP4]AEO97046.1 hypothetical protein [Salmonella phage vB_SenM-S16]